MSEVVEGTAKLTEADRGAIATYLNSVPPLPSKGRLTTRVPRRRMT
jgi:hypothetical protein